MKTESDWMCQAIYIQDACNLCAVAQSFAEMCLDLHRAGITGDSLREHPAVILFVNKIESMTNSSVGLIFSKAYDTCFKEVARIAEEKLNKIIAGEEGES